MDDERTAAQERADGLRAALTVKTNVKGQPVWYACWRDSGGKPVMRTVGPAWLAAINPDPNVFIEKDAARQRAKHLAESWRQGWKVKGRDKSRKGLSMDDREAMAKASAMMLAREVEFDDLADRIAHKHDPRSFAALVDRWLVEKRAEVRDGLLRPSTLADYEGMLRAPAEGQGGRREPHARVLRGFGDCKPREVTGQEIDEFLKALRDEHNLSERTRQKYAVVLGMIFSYALDEKWIKTNPMLDRKRAKRAKKQRKVLVVYTIEQVEQIARQAGGQDGEIIRLAAYSGLRQGELLALKWSDIDWTGGQITVQTSWDHRAGVEGLPKSGHARTVPLADPAGQVLERVSRRDEKCGPRDLVFIGDRTDHVDASALRKRYCAARDTVRKTDENCPQITFHGLRHSFGSLLAGAGLPITSIKDYMGHADIATTAIYTHFIPRAGAAAELTRALSRDTVQMVDAEAEIVV